MYDAGKVIVGLLIFAALITSPFWLNVAGGKASYRPDPVIQTKDVPGKDTCVLPVDSMRTYHMELLNAWRDQAVREDRRVYVAEDGRVFNKSLSNTCMDCHKNKDTFCDRCHNYMDVDPYCWDCHVAPPTTEPKGVE